MNVKTRYRVERRFFREDLIVLQLEKPVPSNAMDPPPYTMWIDATPDDLINDIRIRP